MVLAMTRNFRASAETVEMLESSVFALWLLSKDRLIQIFGTLLGAQKYSSLQHNSKDGMTYAASW